MSTMTAQLPTTAALALLKYARGKKPVTLVLNENFDTRNLLELPVQFTGTVENSVQYAEANGYRWQTDFDNIFCGYFVHAIEPKTLFVI